MAMSGTTTHSVIVKASVASLSKELDDQWGAAGWVLEDSAVVDAHNLVPVTLVALWTQLRCSLAPG